MKNLTTAITRPTTVPAKTLTDLNSKLLAVRSAMDLLSNLDSHVASDLDEFNPNDFLLLSATATVYGTSEDDAYLSIEMIMVGHEMSPLFASFALPGSKSKYNNSFNKDFADIHRYARKTICDFWRAIAGTLTFKGNGLPIGESRK